MSGRGRNSSIVARVALVCFGTLIGLAMAEAIARFLYKAPWYDELVEVQSRNQQLSYKTNSYGFRDDDFPTPKPAGQRRTMVLGDSFTFGLGVPNDEEVFVSVLERRLNEGSEAGGPKRVDLLNCGVSGSLTARWLRESQKIRPVYQPDVVLIVFFLRDGTRGGSIPQFFGSIRRGITERNQRSVAYRFSYLYRFIQDWRDREAVARTLTETWHDSYFGDGEQTAEWQAAQQNLLQIRDLARANSAVVGMVIFPVLVELNPPYPFRDICDCVESYAVSNEIPVHNLLPAFLGEQAADLWVSPMDQHPNARAHAIAAESMLPFVRTLLAAGADDKP